MPWFCTEKGDKGDKGAPPNTSLFRLISDSYSRADIDTWIAAHNTSINNNSQEIINLQVAISGLQFQDNLLQNSINNINATLTSLQNQINAIPAPLTIEAGGVQYVPDQITFFGHPLIVGWWPNTKELVLTFY